MDTYDQAGVEVSLDVAEANNGNDVENGNRQEKLVITEVYTPRSTSPNELSCSTSDVWMSEDERLTKEEANSSLAQKQDRSPGSRFFRVLVLVLLLCVAGIIAASVAAANKNNNRVQSSSSNLEADGSLEGDGNATQAEAADSPTDSPKISAAPSAQPVVQETASPTLSPTTAFSSIRAIKSRYEYAESITFSFTLQNDVEAQADDWIGIYPADTSSSNLQDAEAFMFLCNRETLCDSPVSSGQVTFGDSVMAEARLASWTWPLEPGTYKGYVLRGFQAPFQVLVESTSFEIEENLILHTVAPLVQQMRKDIRALVRNDEFLGPKFVRLGFHDCVGGCDGCVDMTFADNAGLEVPIAALEPIVAQYENPAFHLSRADIWVMAALVGADMAQRRSDTKVNFNMEYIGRKNCGDRFSQCFDQDGNERECSATLGPHVALPEPDITTEELFHFFNNEFGYSVQETVALMGAHTLGTLSRTNSGFNGTNGWVRDNLLLDNDYYHELVGGEEGSSVQDLVDLAPPWLRFEIDNSDLDGIPDRRAWRAFPPALDGNGVTEILMLNADVAMVRELNEDNMIHGRVTCAFTSQIALDSGTRRCPRAQESLEFAAEYKFDNDLWLNDFRDVYHKMLNHGYDYDPSQECLGNLCVY